MPSVVLNVSNFNYYAFHPKSSDLSKKDQKTALVSTILMGVFTLGLGHLVCAVVYGIKSSLAKKVNKIAEPIISNELGKKTDDKRELRPQANSLKEKPNPSSTPSQAITADEKPQTNSIPLEIPKENPNSSRITTTQGSTADDNQNRQDPVLPEFDLSTLGTRIKMKRNKDGALIKFDTPNFLDDDGKPDKEIFLKTEKIDGDLIICINGFKYYNYLLVRYLDESNQPGVFFFLLKQIENEEPVFGGCKIPGSGSAKELLDSIGLISLDKTGKLDKGVRWLKFFELVEKGEITGINPNFPDPITIKLKSKG